MRGPTAMSRRTTSLPANRVTTTFPGTRFHSWGPVKQRNLHLQPPDPSHTTPAPHTGRLHSIEHVPSRGAADDAGAGLVGGAVDGCFGHQAGCTVAGAVGRRAASPVTRQTLNRGVFSAASRP
jgi:hypothetical protein